MNYRATLLVAGALLCRATAFGLATESIGPAKDVVNQSGWPKGIAELVGHPSRVYANWVNGNETFYFKATPAEMNELLELFSKCVMRERQAHILPGSRMIQSFRQQEFEYNVSLKVLSGIALYARREKSAEDTLEPSMAVFVGEGLAIANQLKLPTNLVVDCKVPGANIHASAKPVRTARFGRVVFPDGKPAVDFEHGVSTRVTLWQKDSENGMEVASLDKDGFFRVALSQEEFVALKEGRTRLTLKTGNHLAKAAKSDPNYPAGSLALEQGQVRPLQISPPVFYFGRLLFEDNTPAVLQQKPWPGAEIWVDFPYCGPARIDAEGYFRVTLEPQQFEDLKARKPYKNVYVPGEAQGQSSAKAAFPGSWLSLSKQTAGLVRIPKPVYDLPQ